MASRVCAIILQVNKWYLGDIAKMQSSIFFQFFNFHVDFEPPYIVLKFSQFVLSFYYYYHSQGRQNDGIRQPILSLIHHTMELHRGHHHNGTNWHFIFVSLVQRVIALQISAQEL